MHGATGANRRLTRGSGPSHRSRDDRGPGHHLPAGSPYGVCEVLPYFVSSISSQPVIIALRWLLQVWPVVMM